MRQIDLQNGIFSPALKRTLADGVVSSIRDAILSGRLSPGERLSEQDLAKSLKVSRGPIREALDRLERQGLVISHPNGRSYVARLSRQDLEEVYSLRIALETLAVQLASRCATSRALEDLQAVVDAMAAFKNGDLTEQQAAEMDLRFHDALCRASNNKRLYDIWSNLRPQLHILLLSRNVADPDFRNLAVKTHQAILDAIRARDEERATALMQAHFHGSYERIVKSYGSPASVEDDK